MFLKAIQSWLNQSSFGSMLEQYIVSGYPKSIYDVERLTREFELKHPQGRL